MPSTVFRGFLGHKPDVSQAPFNSGVSGKNYQIHKHRDAQSRIPGWIEAADGYSKKFVSLPVDDTLKKISGLTVENIYNLYIPEHGGQAVTLVTANYTKTGYFSGSPTVNRLGIFARPYWNGSAWIDEWRELTEMFIFELMQLDPIVETEFLTASDWTSVDWTGSFAAGWTHPSTGEIATWSLANGGSGYTEGQILTAVQVGGSGGTFLIDVVDGAGTILRAIQVDKGTGYYAGEPLATTVDTGPGVNATILPLTVGNTSVLSQSKPAVVGTVYEVTYTVNGRTTGAFDLAFGGASVGSITNTGSLILTADTTGNLTITPTGNFNGQVVISIKTFSGGDRLYIDDTGHTYDFLAKDLAGTVFNTSYFKDWTIRYGETFADSENYDLVAGCGYGGSGQFYLKLLPGHLHDDFPSRVVGTKLTVYRSFLTGEIPQSLSTHIYGLLSEARVSTGNAATDKSLMVAHRDTSFINANPSYARAIDEILAGPAMTDLWQYAALFVVDAAVSTPTDYTDIPAGTYYVKQAIVFDDGSRTKLYNAQTCTGAHIWEATQSGNTVVIAAGQSFSYYIYRSPGALPVRARYLQLYLSDDDITYWKTKTFDLRDSTLWSNAGVVTLFGGTASAIKHWYAGNRNATSRVITGDDWNADTATGGATAETDTGRAITDSGVVQFAHAMVAGRRAFAVGVRVDGVLYPNIGFVTPQNGDGGPQYDVFPLLSTLNINLEDNDGDQLKAVYPAGDRILFLKRSNVSLITPDSSGVFLRDVVTQADGICSNRSLASFEDVIYWAGYNGVYAFSPTTGIRVINNDWLLEWKAVSTANKESAIGAIDRSNRQYRLAYAGIERCLDVDSGEWVCADLEDQPSRFAMDSRNTTLDFLSGSYIQTFAAGILHDTKSFTVQWRSNEFEGAPQGGLNLLLTKIKIKFNSSVPLTAQLYASGVALGTAVTLVAGDREAFVKAPLSSRCKRFGISLSATVTANAQVVQIKELVPEYQFIPAGVSDNV